MHMIEKHGGRTNNEDDGHHKSLLYYAICGGNHILVESLLERGMNPNIGII